MVISNGRKGYIRAAKEEGFEREDVGRHEALVKYQGPQGPGVASRALAMGKEEWSVGPLSLLLSRSPMS